MILTNKFIFIHMHKCGGTFVNNALEKYVTDFKKLGYHLPSSEIPEQFGHLPVVGLVRNPWDFYTSLYFFQKNAKIPNVIYRAFSNNGTLDFHQTILNMTNPMPIHFSFIKKYVSKSFGVRGVNLTENCVDLLSNLEGGWYSRLFQRMYLNTTPVLLRQENLRNDLITVIRMFGLKTEEGFSHFVKSGAKCNVSLRNPYPNYYSSALAKEVEFSEQKIINDFDYSFNRDFLIKTTSDLEVRVKNEKE